MFGWNIAPSLDDESLVSSLDAGWVLTDAGLRFLNRKGNSRIEMLPDVDVAWSELAEWLLPGAACRAK